jgi:hypothetical protein
MRDKCGDPAALRHGAVASNAGLISQRAQSNDHQRHESPCVAFGPDVVHPEGTVSIPVSGLTGILPAAVYNLICWSFSVAATN